VSGQAFAVEEGSDLSPGIRPKPRKAQPAPSEVEGKPTKESTKVAGKLEARISKFETSSNAGNLKFKTGPGPATAFRSSRHSDSEFVSSFVLRNSNFLGPAGWGLLHRPYLLHRRGHGGKPAKNGWRTAMNTDNRPSAGLLLITCHLSLITSVPPTKPRSHEEWVQRSLPSAFLPLGFLPSANWLQTPEHIKAAVLALVRTGGGKTVGHRHSGHRAQTQRPFSPAPSFAKDRGRYSHHTGALAIPSPAVSNPCAPAFAFAQRI
jgi:hypothetical protein